MPLSISQHATNIANDEKPVILFDTCSLLDIVRTPDRENIVPDIITSALNFTSLANVWLLASQIVEKEWQDNIDAVSISSKNSIRQLHKKANCFKGALDHTPTAESWNYDKPFISFSLEEKLKNISEQLVGRLNYIENDNDCFTKASMRVINNVAPASRGKNEYKDCMIIEHYLELCKELRGLGFLGKVIFISSNKNDFGAPYEIKSPLDVEFDAVQLTYVADLKQAEVALS